MAFLQHDKLTAVVQVGTDVYMLQVHFEDKFSYDSPLRSQPIPHTFSTAHVILNGASINAATAHLHPMRPDLFDHIG